MHLMSLFYDQMRLNDRIVDSLLLMRSAGNFNETNKSKIDEQLNKTTQALRDYIEDFGTFLNVEKNDK